VSNSGAGEREGGRLRIKGKGFGGMNATALLDLSQTPSFIYAVFHYADPDTIQDELSAQRREWDDER
jgi:hypothetical protein